MLLRTTAVAAPRRRVAQLGATVMQKRSWSFWEWAAKYDRPFAVPLAWTIPPRDLGWKMPDKINLREIEEGWQTLPEGQKSAIIKFLLQKQKGDWNKMTWEEKKASWWIEFGEHGMRKPKQPGHGWRVFGGSVIGIAAGVGLFAFVRQFAEPYHPGLTREWQEATNEQLRRHYSDPITGVASEGYKGKGAVFL